MRFDNDHIETFLEVLNKALAPLCTKIELNENLTTGDEFRKELAHLEYLWQVLSAAVEIDIRAVKKLDFSGGLS